MERSSNPYTPNAGAPPRYLAGRRTEVDDFRTLLRRLARGYTEQSVVITGLRGVGKTVLLGEYRRIADEESWVPIDAEVSRTRPSVRRSPIWDAGLSFQCHPRLVGVTAPPGQPASSSPSPSPSRPTEV
ncbi:hypothetical protein DQ238_20780 [Geodermatophilus sp. TF02-6]|uniref:ATP-binding protein n=1 Tax=Geodermatophilus sp. TF02-6 TaxID=2250575 RepID=UPI000DE82F25|nr:hypothetical protein DQ238_20780 [Geodermatophilus sp. TF02-6]